ncbi:MAG: magnesium transporter CorA family protein [SAR202 cluster bacterium]|nr:magnesium transporter CorA family protein [SAR202 cluster bacterium]
MLQDFGTLLYLNTNFMEGGEGRLVLSFRYFDPTDPIVILFFTPTEILLYAERAPDAEALRAPDALAGRPYGKSTALALWAARKAIGNYRGRLEDLINELQDLERQFDHPRYRQLVLEFSRVFDRLEDLRDVLLTLEETTVAEVETRYVSFDWKVLLAENSNLVDRCQHRINMLRDIAHDHEIQTTSELNRRIERLNDVVRRLTAITLILMIPTLITSHFGMNFTRMPELGAPWGYPAVIAAEVTLLVAGAIAFRRIGWL